MLSDAMEKTSLDTPASSPAASKADTFGFRLRHVGVAVPKLAPAAASLQKLFGYEMVSGPFDDPIQRVTVSFLKQAGDDTAEIELIAPLTDDAPIRAMLAKDIGAYHFCFETTDIDGALVHAKEQGCIVVSGPAPAVAFGGRRIAWLYAPTRQLFELVETEQRADEQTESNR
jgi:methylmalonyl-CoA/ethylmalonyl-CoA epimerase